ncbi:MAG TPA: DUF1501 domain-containing protein [Planctomycetota bacterium]|nr:DUF1501 domain-containing protein [Planctomycetota bacterium]
MLTLTGGTYCCDGVSRRSFLQIGAAGVGGLLLPQLLRAEARGASRKSLINIYLGGGPSHQDMWDLKPEAPSEYRGEFSPIGTNVPGMEICELFPRLARRADKFSIIRGLVGSVDEHSYNTAMTGYPEKSLDSVGGRPSNGSVLAWLRSDLDNPAPPYVSLMGRVTPGYLGPVYGPYVPDGDGRQNLKLGKIDGERMKGRTALLKELDTLRRDADSSGKMEALDAFTQRAVDVVTSGRMADALDVEKEKPEIVRMYTNGERNGRSGDNRKFLMARRLVEAGVRCVALNWGGWDTHENNFKSLRTQLPALDTGLSALLDDLSARGLLQDTAIVMWGEFGRTPKVNDKAGRDHWPRVSAAWVAGGGFKAGRVVGASDRTAGEALAPVHVHQVHATLYHLMGVDVSTAQLTDPSGRPQYLLDTREPIRELV